MRKFGMILLIAGLMVLVACGEDDSSSGEESNESSSTNTSTANDDVTEDEEEVEVADEGDSDGIIDIFSKTIEAMNEVQGMRVMGESTSTSSMSNVTTDKTQEIIGELSLDPMSLHYQIHSTSEGLNQEMELYHTVDGMYMKSIDTEDWILIPMNDNNLLMNNTGASVTTTQLEYFMKHEDKFTLTEEDNQYLVTFTGEGDVFKEVSFGYMKELSGEEGFQSLLDSISETKGTYKLYIDKEKYYIVGLDMDVELTIDMGNDVIKSHDISHYEYSDFNQVEPPTVPDEVKENAQSLTIPDIPTGD